VKVLLVAGARPNFMKIAPVFRASRKYTDVLCNIVHTGQHYDHDMSHAFFSDLDIPDPDHHLAAGSGSHAAQTARIMTAFEEVCETERPDVVVVVGDVNSTLACSIVAKKMLIDVAHIEAGLRSFDLTMPEEINRIVTDSITDYFFVSEPSGVENLTREGKRTDRIFLVGNVMIDNLLYELGLLSMEDTKEFSCCHMKEILGKYIFLTLHRPSNVDSRETLHRIMRALNEISHETPIIFSVHPRTKKNLSNFNLSLSGNIHMLPPLGFRESLFLWKDAALVMTDSGGLQEETTALRVPCITLRENTERPITVEQGSNIMGGTTEESIWDAYQRAICRKRSDCRIPDKWDGKASERIWEILTHQRNL
jgi:UDP-N-acetylglucosamine 2-epimerase (non-hydrolysing)